MKSILARLRLGGCVGAALLGVVFPGVAWAQPPPDPELFWVGTFGDDDRTVTCVSGQPGATFPLALWAWVPDDLGLAYLTLRFDFPDNLDLSAHAAFHPLISNVIITEYAGGTSEWNLVFGGCPSGWIRVFEQPCVLLDDQPGQITILEAHSMMRECSRFILHELAVLNNLGLNDPDCATVPIRPTGWGAVKARYR